jgi:chemotaxis protein methyltransferase CheR
VTLSSSSGAKPIPLLGYGDYLRFSKLVEDRSGLYFPEKRRTDLEQGLRHAFAASTCTDLEEYYHLLQDPTDGALEMDRLINALTVGETYFFRDAGQFDALYSHVLPQLIERRRLVRTLRLWSAGCASGEEPYSIAMMLRELLPDVDEWTITILGTDVNTEALDRARKAVYGDWAFREERARQWRARYFHSQGSHYELIPEVRRMVTFARLNLAGDSYPAFETNTTLMDLILCRNVTIYFGEAVTRGLVERLYNALVDGGWLAVGHAEPSPFTYRRFQVHNFPHAILYQRTGQPTVLPAEWEWLAGQPEADRVTPVQAIVLPPEPVPISADVPPAPVFPSSLPASLPEEGDPLERARELLDYGHSEQARDLLLAVVAQQPRHAPTCALLGQAYANLGCWPEAEQWCRQAARLDKLALEAYYTLALVLQHQSRLDEAIDAMKKVVYIDRHSVLGHFGLADLYRNKGRLPQAQRMLDNARRLLEMRTADEVIPGSGGITAGRLRDTIVRQQQQWGRDRMPGT